MKNLENVPIESFMKALLEIYEKGYDAVNISVATVREDGSYQLLIEGMGPIADMKGDDDFPDELLDVKNLN